MTLDQLTKIEKNKKFRRHICNKGIWKNYAFVPPSIVLFCGMFGLLYLFNQDMLISLKCIPFVIIFLIGTIWFKSTRKLLINKRLNTVESLAICKAIPLEDKSKYNQIYIFTSNNNKFNVDYLDRQKEKLIEENDLSETSISFNKATLIKNNDIFITKIKKSKSRVATIGLLNKEEVVLLTKKDITKYKY